MRQKYIAYIAVFFMTMLCAFVGCKKEEKPTDEVTGTPSVEGTITGEAEQENKQEGYDTYTEASMLTELVFAKVLPQIEVRLPKKEDVFTKQDSMLGEYGDEVQFAVANADVITGELLSEGLFCYGQDGAIVPNIAKAYTVNDDFTEYTIYLRKGMRWSDGVLFTADDCIFFYEKLCVAETFGEPLWDCFTVGDGFGVLVKATFQKVDAYTFKVIFQKSKPDFLSELVEQGGICFAPEHYHVNLLPEYMGEDASAAKAKEMGYADVAEMLKKTVVNAWNVPGVPTLNPYVISEEEGLGNVAGDYYEFVRNPFYWKIDANGKQLPYLNRLGFTRVSGESQRILLTTEGFLSVSELSAGQIAEAQAAAERGGYRIIKWTDSVSYAVKHELQNFPEQCPYEEKIRGIGAAHVESWYIK